MARNATVVMSDVLEATVSAFPIIFCVMETTTAVITEMKINNSVKTAVSHFLSYKMHGRRFLYNIGGTIDRGAGGAEGVEEVGFGGVGLGREQCPLPRKFFDCGSQNGEF